MDVDIVSSPLLRAWLSKRFAQPVSAHDMIHALSYQRQGSIDDRTAVLIFSPGNRCLTMPGAAELFD
jgi:hypothetical protein